MKSNFDMNDRMNSKHISWNILYLWCHMASTIIGVNIKCQLNELWWNSTYNYRQKHRISQRSQTSLPDINIVDTFPKISRTIIIMMTSSNGNIFRVTGHLCGEFTGPRWLLRTKASDAELWCFLWSASKYTVEYREAGDLRRNQAHYDVIVMCFYYNWQAPFSTALPCIVWLCFGLW